MFSYLRANYLQGGIPSEIGELVHLTILYGPFLHITIAHHLPVLVNFTVLLLSFI
jgi:hypothetical protein